MGIGEKPCINFGKHSRAWSVQCTRGVHPSLVVTRILKRTCGRSERVYDLKVKNAGTFVVGTAIVHNCHRIGTEGSVTCWYLVGDGTMDEHMEEVLMGKMRVLEAAMGDGDEQAAAEARGISLVDEVFCRLTEQEVA